MQAVIYKYNFIQLLLLIFITASITACSTNKIDGIYRLNNAQFERKLSKQGFVLLDVRTPAEFDSAHIPGAININVLDSIQFLASIAKQPLQKKYLIYCRSGKRSMVAARQMRQMGFTKLKELERGFQKWEGTTVTGN